jgi:SAM-dependent methyltransferase
VSADPIRARREADDAPHHTLGLEAMTGAVRYRRYLAELLRPHLGRTVLEIGSGLGDLADELRDLDRLVVSDVDPVCLRALTARFSGRPDVEVVPVDARETAPGLGILDTVLAVNVLEHLVDDVAALRRMSEMVKPGGHVVLFVPAYPSLYGPHDRAAGHVRRYVPRTLRAAVVAAGLRAEVLRPVNFVGGLAWWVAVRVGGCARPRRALVTLYDRILVPLVRVMEARWHPPFGQSLLCVARVSPDPTKARETDPSGDAGRPAG